MPEWPSAGPFEPGAMLPAIFLNSHVRALSTGRTAVSQPPPLYVSVLLLVPAVPSHSFPSAHPLGVFRISFWSNSATSCLVGFKEVAKHLQAVDWDDWELPECLGKMA